jgi:hypothetical protein
VARLYDSELSAALAYVTRPSGVDAVLTASNETDMQTRRPRVVERIRSTA